MNHDTDCEHCSSCDVSLNNKKSNNCSTTHKTNDSKISISQFEGLIKFILTDYMKIKDENMHLKNELELKIRKIELLKKAIDSISVSVLSFLKSNLN